MEAFWRVFSFWRPSTKNAVPSQRKCDNELLETNCAVLTGPPSSGKTTVLRCLQAQGHLVSGDSTRALIARETASGRSAQEFRFGEDFQPRVLQAMKDAQESLNKTDRIFLEYALPCNIAFHRTEGRELTSGLANAAASYRYAAVFIFDPLPWTVDTERVEDAEYQRTVHKHLDAVYRELRYQPVHVPVLDAHERVAFIMKHVKSIVPKITTCRSI